MSLATPIETLTTCPYCGHAIGTSERDRILSVERERIEARLQDALETEEARLRVELSTEFSKEADILREAKQQAEFRVTSLEQQIDARLDEARKHERNALQAEMAEQLKSEADRAGRAEAELLELRESIQEQIDDRVERERLRVENELHKELHEKDKKLDLANKNIETMKKALEGRTPYELGGIQEDDLVQHLSAEFPRDRIRRITGRAGADVEHEIFHEGERCGLIIYECKNVQNWQPQFISKLHKDKIDLAASYAMLVSTAFPPRARDFCLQDEICVVHPRLVQHVVCIVRQALIDIHAQSLSQRERGFKLEQLMIFLNSVDFKNKMGAVFRAVDKLEALQQKERRAHDKTWSEQTIAVRSIRNSTTDVQGEISSILARG